MVVKLENVSSLYTNMCPTKSRRDMDTIVTDCPRRQKLRCSALPALVEDETEEVYQEEQHSFVLHSERLLRQKSVSPQRRERLRRQLALPSLSEDEEP